MKILKPAYNIVFLLLTSILCQAQTHQIIIQLNDDINIQQLKSLPEISLVTSYKQLSKNLNIWLIEIPTTLNTQTTLKNESTLLNLKKRPKIKAAQFNEAIELRNTPNDEYFEEQWQYFNKGAMQGVTDADIDALKAWDIITGGTTTQGDEIVVAVIDGGVDLNHPDLINNLWTNSNEIPNNQIDDDQNGYIDDYYGWNFNDSTPDIGNDGYGHWHGTPVAGIIGAVGNNYEGVTGVNWQVKIMNMVANQTVADVIAAYDYILSMRKRYNETNGVAGSFVVATNASLGINEGKPADHPIWCAMYNALGKAGVLSVAATANNPINVDERGDLPTTCSSNYLISVTNTNNRDELDFAAFGRQHIDLGAPGSSVFTTVNNGEYGYFGGTSAAAPHVAGTIALLYATPNPNLVLAVNRNPAATALLVKDFILRGTDPISDLYRKSVSNGRLNLFNSFCEMENYFAYYSQSTHNIQSSCIEAKEVSLQIDEVRLNTANHQVNIHFEFKGKSNLKIRLFNTNGQLLQQQQHSNINTGKHQLYLELDQLTAGVYFIYINFKNTALSEAIVVH